MYSSHFIDLRPYILHRKPQNQLSLVQFRDKNFIILFADQVRTPLPCTILEEWLKKIYKDRTKQIEQKCTNSKEGSQNINLIILFM